MSKKKFEISGFGLLSKIGILILVLLFIYRIKITCPSDAEYGFKSFICDMNAGDYLVALFTFALSISTYLLWKSGEVHSERSLRAYCLVSKVALSGIGVGQTPIAKVDIKNQGQTPADNLQVSIRIGVQPYPLKEFPPLAEDERSGSALGAGTRMEYQAKYKGMLSRQDIDDIITGVSAVYVVGKIEYRDIFGIKRKSHIKLFSSPTYGIPLNAMSPCIDGNDFT